jgi:hypothetical protein
VTPGFGAQEFLTDVQMLEKHGRLQGSAKGEDI